jgi:peptidoglycan/xylan/chitin deacetylase (PgdA/CDA1 family)
LGGKPQRVELSIRSIKLSVLSNLKNCRAFDIVAGSRWRTSRLLILCYHGISLRDEHCWNSGLYISPQQFADRLKRIRAGGYKVLPLAEGVQGLYANQLPPRSVVITFDDGLFDFYARAWPLLQEFQFPATVYLTTFYSEYNRPIFRLVCDYMMWQKRGALIECKHDAPGITSTTIDLRTPESRSNELSKLDEFAKTNELSALDKDCLAQDFARRIGADWQAILNDRLLHIMNPSEACELARSGLDLQLHTHRHRTPQDEALFRRELDDNATRLQSLTGHKPSHFCYPSGVLYSGYPAWLRRWGVESAVTCELGVAEARTDAMMLPRLCDHAELTAVEFEAWLSGMMRWFPKRRYAAVDPD